MDSIKSSQESRIEMLKKYLADDPTDDFSRYALALEYLKKAEHREAMNLLVQLLEHNPHYLPAYYQLGKLYELENLPDQAAEIYERGMDVAQVQKNPKTMNELRAALDLL